MLGDGGGGGEGGPAPAFNPKELICGACSNTLGQADCRYATSQTPQTTSNPLFAALTVSYSCPAPYTTASVHGDAYMEWKCRFCCSLATYFCGGKARFCTPCHDRVGPPLLPQIKSLALRPYPPFSTPFTCMLAAG
jgi:hypothetical protein